jgi:hypothetical protein
LWNEVGFDEADLLWEESIYAETEEITFKIRIMPDSVANLPKIRPKTEKGHVKNGTVGEHLCRLI